jgi:hypothetical protein
MSEIPVHFRPRKLTDWINPTGAKKVHSLIDKVWQRASLSHRARDPSGIGDFTYPQ